MRILIFTFIVFIGLSANAQSIPGQYIDPFYRGTLLQTPHLKDSAYGKKWLVTKYAGLSTSFSFYKGGHATTFAAPLALQLNRRLNNNLFAFGNVAVAPAYTTTFSGTMFSGFSKSNFGNAVPFNSSALGIYTKAELGLQYINDERTFSISGSIGVERNAYPFQRSNNNRQMFPVNNQ